MRNTLLRCGLASLILLMAGCVDPAAPKDKPEPPTEPPGHAAHWNATWKGPLAYQFTLRAPASTTCTSTLTYTAAPTPGWSGLIVRNPETDPAWAIFAVDRHEQHLHVGPLVDSRRLLPAPGEGDSIPLIDESELGPEGVTLLLAAQDVVPGPDAGPNVSVSVVCEGPFSIEDLKAGREVALFDRSMTAGGVGAHADTLLLGSVGATVNDGFQVELTAPEALVFIAGAAAHAARVELEAPSGSHAFDFLPEYEGERAFHVVRDGPGAYFLWFSEAGVFDEHLWGAFVGLHPVATFGDVARLKPGHAHACPASPLDC